MHFEPLLHNARTGNGYIYNKSCDNRLVDAPTTEQTTQMQLAQALSKTTISSPADRYFANAAYDHNGNEYHRKLHNQSEIFINNATSKEIIHPSKQNDEFSPLGSSTPSTLIIRNQPQINPLNDDRYEAFFPPSQFDVRRAVFKSPTEHFDDFSSNLNFVGNDDLLWAASPLEENDRFSGCQSLRKYSSGGSKSDKRIVRFRDEVVDEQLSLYHDGNNNSSFCKRKMHSHYDGNYVDNADDSIKRICLSPDAETNVYFKSPWSDDSSAHDSYAADAPMTPTYPFESHHLDFEDLALHHWMMRKRELDLHPTFCLKGQNHVTMEMRTILVDWFILLTRFYGHQYGTVHLAVNILDRYLEKNKGIIKTNFQLVGITCMLIAGKQLEIDANTVYECKAVCSHIYQTVDILRQEKEILSSLKFVLHVPTSHYFLDVFFFVYCNLSDTSHAALTKYGDNFYKRLHLVSRYLLEKGLSSYYFMQSAHSVCANASIVLAWKIIYSVQLEFDDFITDDDNSAEEVQDANCTSEHLASFYNELKESSNDDNKSKKNDRQSTSVNSGCDEEIDLSISWPDDAIFNIRPAVDYYFRDRLDLPKKTFDMKNKNPDDVELCENSLVEFIGKTALLDVAVASFKFYV